MLNRKFVKILKKFVVQIVQMCYNSEVNIRRCCLCH